MTKPQVLSKSGVLSAVLDRPYVLVVLAPLFWGGNMVAGKLAVGQVDPYTLSVLRWLGALLITLPFAWRPLQKDWPVLRRHWPILALYGALGYTTFNVLMYLAAYFTSAVNSSIEQALIPVLVMIANFLVFGVRAKALQIVGVVITIIGIAITASHGDFGRVLALTINQGDALVVLACVAYAIYSLALRFRPPIHWMSFLVATFVAALVTGYIFQVFFGGGALAILPGVEHTTPLGWLIIVYVAFFPSVLSQLFYARGVELIGPNRASLFINLIPVFGTLLSLLVLSEPLETYHLVTAALVLIGIVLAEYAARRRA
ncbi:MAG TPA: DMT family transporter [Devosiaceae bacterium]|jgi:drug/metabolite transporter (DMT)-like permease